jgi:hypothetical protein
LNTFNDLSPGKSLGRLTERSLGGTLCGKKWENQDAGYVLANYGKSTSKEIAAALGRSLPSIYCEAKKLGLRSYRSGIGRKWKEEEILYLDKSYKEKPVRQIAIKLYRSPSSVQQKARRIGLKSSLKGMGNIWTPRETEFLSKNIEKMSMGKIAEILGKSLRSIYGKKRELFPNKNLSIMNFDNTPTPEMAYVLGVIFGDGCVTCYRKQNSYRIQLTCTDREFAESFKCALEAIGLRPSLRFAKPPTKNRKAVWRVEALSKLFYEWFRTLNFEELKLFLRTKELKREFIRGFYESEGCLHKVKTRKRGWCIYICNTNEDLTKLVRAPLSDLGFLFSVWISRRPRRKPLYVIGTGRFDNIVRFLLEIEPSIPRKSIASLEEARVI